MNLRWGMCPPPPVLHGSYISEKLGRKNISITFSQHTFAELCSIIVGYFLLLDKYLLILKGISKFVSLDLSVLFVLDLSVYMFKFYAVNEKETFWNDPGSPGKSV